MKAKLSLYLSGMMLLAILTLGVGCTKAPNDAQLTSNIQSKLPGDREEVLAANTELAKRAIRVLALAYRDVPEGYREEISTSGLVFVGLVGMIDPLREEAKAAIESAGGPASAP